MNNYCMIEVAFNNMIEVNKIIDVSNLPYMGWILSAMII